MLYYNLFNVHIENDECKKSFFLMFKMFLMQNNHNLWIIITESNNTSLDLLIITKSDKRIAMMCDITERLCG